MIIEVLFVPGCPNHEPAVRGLRRVLSSETSVSRSRRSLSPMKRWRAHSNFLALQPYASMGEISNRIGSDPMGLPAGSTPMGLGFHH